MGNRLPLDSLGQAGKNLGVHPGISVPTDTAVTAMAGSGFGLTAGIGLASPPSSTAAVDSWTMSTDSSNSLTYSAVNLIGNDEVTNPRHKLNSNSANGTRPAGTLTEAELLAGGTRYYCAALFFPSDTSNLTASNSAGDNAAIGGAMTYYLSVAAAQQFNRSVD
jgi:hypothetical protein